MSRSIGNHVLTHNVSQVASRRGYWHGVAIGLLLAIKKVTDFWRPARGEKRVVFEADFNECRYLPTLGEVNLELLAGFYVMTMMISKGKLSREGVVDVARLGWHSVSGGILNGT